MRREKRRGLLAALALGFALAASPASAASAGEVFTGVVDVVWVRPLNLAALAVGTAFFAISVPLVAPFEGVGTAWDVFVYAPYEYTFLRPIGDL